MKADQYRYWRGRPARERMAAVSELTTAAYALKAWLPMYQDFKDLLSAFRAHGVKYLIVGGYAVSSHSQPRATEAIHVEDLPNPRYFTGSGGSLLRSISCQH